MTRDEPEHAPLGCPNGDQVTRVWESALRDQGFSGTVVVTSARGTVVLSSGQALPGRALRGTTAVDIMSISKVFTSLAVLLLQEEGRLGLMDPIGRWWHTAPPDKRSITVADLLTHRAGIVDGADGIGDYDAVTSEDMGRRRPNQLRGRRRWPRPLLRLARMAGPAPDRRPQEGPFGALWGAGELYMPAPVLGSLRARLIDGRLTSPRIVSQLSSPVTGDDRTLALEVDDTGSSLSCLTHGGDATFARGQVRICPQQQIAIAAWVNSIAPSAHRAMRLVAAAVLDRGEAPVELGPGPWPATPEAALFQFYLDVLASQDVPTRRAFIRDALTPGWVQARGGADQLLTSMGRSGWSIGRPQPPVVGDTVTVRRATRCRGRTGARPGPGRP